MFQSVGDRPSPVAVMGLFHVDSITRFEGPGMRFRLNVHALFKCRQLSICIDFSAFFLICYASLCVIQFAVFAVRSGEPDTGSAFADVAG